MRSPVFQSISTVGWSASRERWGSKLRVASRRREAFERARSTPPGKCIRICAVGLKPSFWERREVSRGSVFPPRRV